uniref:Metalloendopeptidase n=1 Tax=Parastrongyloides trichosuri TaxID=131310 RepID=A0A0N4Z8G2_PARTI
MGISYSNITVNNTIGFNFKRGKNCTAPVGRSKLSNSTYEYIILTKKCEEQKGTVQQLTAKMLGMINTNNRPDRDDYIYVNFSKVKKGKKGLYDKYNWSQVPLYENVSYDYGSALHYPGNYMGKKNMTVMEPRNISYYSYMLGQQYELSFNDLKILNKLYTSEYYWGKIGNYMGKKNMTVMEPRNISYYSYMLGQQYELSFNDLKILNKLYTSEYYWGKIGKCKNSGYIRPFSNSVCLCPNGFTGRYCNETESNTEECKNNSTLRAELKIKNITLEGNINCTHLIKSKPGTTIQLNITSVRTQEKIPCYQKMGLEVKHVKDKGTTGLCLCGNYTNIQLQSEDNKILIQYTGLLENSSALITYKMVSNDKEKLEKV